MLHKRAFLGPYLLCGEQARNRGGQVVQRGDELNLSGAQLYFTEEQLLF